MRKIDLNDGIKLEEIVTKTGASLIGDSQVRILNISSLEEPKENSLSFFRGKSLDSLKELLSSFSSNQIKAVLVNESMNLENPLNGVSFLKVKDPFYAFVKLVPLFFSSDSPNYNSHSSNIHSRAHIEESAKVSPTAKVGPFSYIGEDCIIDDGVIIHPHVTIYPRVKIGANSIIHSGAHIREDVVLKEGVVIQNGAVIGADGFGYLPDPEKGLIPVPQVGNVTLSRAVEIGANTCIDRATLGTTFIDMGSKIDNLVQIGHNTKVGKHTIICGQSAIAGSSKIGNQVVLGGNVGVADHTEVADGCRFGAFSGLHGKYETKGDYAGNPAMPASTYRRVVTLIPKLPELFKKLKN